MKFTRSTVAALTTLCLGAALLVSAPSPTYSAAPHGGKCNQSKMSVNKLLQCVTLQGVMEHEWALQRIANANEGTRASATPGYDASAGYVIKRMRKAGYNDQHPVLPVLQLQGWKDPNSSRPRRTR